MSRRFQVAISFAGAQRDYAEALTNALQARGVAIFYDNLFRHELLGENLSEKFHDVFSDQSDYVVMLISKDYVERVWPRYEGRIALNRAMNQEGAYILPMRFDDTVVKGLLPTIHYETASKTNPQQFAALICRKLAIPPPAKDYAVAAPQITSLIADIAFDYEGFNGRYVLGKGEMAFDTEWTTGSNTSIQSSARGENIRGVAVAVGAKSLSDIDDASTYDFSSTWRRPNIGEYLILRNKSGFYCAVQIKEIRARNYGHDRCHLKIFYVIQEEGGPDFRNYAVFE